jgi:hypothetical protein
MQLLYNSSHAACPVCDSQRGQLLVILQENTPAAVIVPTAKPHLSCREWLHARPTQQVALQTPTACYALVLQQLLQPPQPPAPPHYSHCSLPAALQLTLLPMLLQRAAVLLLPPPVLLLT